VKVENQGSQLTQVHLENGHWNIANAGITCCCVSLSVHPSVTSQCSTETAKCRIMQTAPHNSPVTVVFWCQKSLQNSNRVAPSGGTKCRWGRLNAGTVAENGNFRHKALSTWLSCKFITLSVHIICLQHIRSDAAWSAGLSATADPCCTHTCWMMVTMSSCVMILTAQHIWCWEGCTTTILGCCDCQQSLGFRYRAACSIRCGEQWWLSGQWKGELLQLFCAVLCTTVVHDDTHTYTTVIAVLTDDCWLRFRFLWVFLHVS